MARSISESPPTLTHTVGGMLSSQITRNMPTTVYHIGHQASATCCALLSTTCCCSSLNLNKCSASGGKQYDQDEEGEVTLMGRGIMAWVDDVYIDRVPSGFPLTDSDCFPYFGTFAFNREARPQHARSNNSTRTPASKKADSGQAAFRTTRTPSIDGTSKVRAASSTIEAYIQQQAQEVAHPSYVHGEPVQARTVYKTSVLLNTGTFSVTTRSGNNLYGGTFLYVYGFDTAVQAVAGPVSGHVFTPFSVSLAFESADGHGKHY